MVFKPLIQVEGDYSSSCVVVPKGGCGRYYLTESFYEVVVQKSVPAPIRQRVHYVRHHEGQVDGFVRELTFAK